MKAAILLSSLVIQLSEGTSTSLKLKPMVEGVRHASVGVAFDFKNYP